MHELAVTESILNITLKHAEQAQATQVTDVYLVIGRLSSIVDDSVQFYWDIIAENTIAAGAKLHFERVPAKFLCLDCHTEYELMDVLSDCPNCKSSRIQVLSGEEFRLDSIEVTN